MTTRAGVLLRARWGVLAVAGAVALAGCGGGGGSTDAAPGASAEPITVVVEGIFEGSTNPSFGNVPEARDGAVAYLDAVNKAGGINGHQINIVVCNDQASPDIAAKCARDAVSQDAVAVVSPWHGANGPAILPILERAKIPFLNAPLSPQDYTSPVSFPVGSGATGAFAATAIAMNERGCTKLGMFHYDIAASKGLVDSTRRAATPAGFDIGAIVVNPTASTFADIVAQVQEGGYDCMIPVIAPAQVVPLMQALRTAGISITIGGFAANYKEPELTQISALGGNGSVYSSSYSTGGDSPALQEMRADLAASNVPVAEFSVAGWTEARIVGEIIKQIDGPITAEAVYNALNAADNIDVGTMVPFTTKDPITAQGYNRVFTPFAYTNLLQDGKLTPLSSDPIDIRAAYGPATG